MLSDNYARTSRLITKQAEYFTQVEAQNMELQTTISELQAMSNSMRDRLLAAGLTVDFTGRSETGGTGESSVSKPVLPIKRTPALLQVWGMHDMPAPLSPCSTAPTMDLPGAVGGDNRSDEARGNLQSPGAEQAGSSASQIVIAELEEEINKLRDELRRATDATTEPTSAHHGCDRAVKSEPLVAHARKTSVSPSRATGTLDTASSDAALIQECTSILPVEGPQVQVEGASRASRVSKLVDHASEEASKLLMQPKAVFADAAAMKEKLRQALGQPEYNVHNFYHETGVWRRIACSHLFDNITLTVIAFNALWIAIDTDLNEADLLLDAKPFFIIVENVFCAYFSFEWFVRYMAFRVKRNGLRDGWFVFDSALVLIMVFETWVFTTVILLGTGGSSIGVDTAVLKLFRLVRLTRMARMARLLRAMPELMIMIKGMTVAMRSVFFTLFLLVCIVYVFAIAFVQLMGPRGTLPNSDAGDNFFPNVSQAMKSLLLGGVMPDQAELITGVGDVHPVMFVLIMIYILLAGLTVMNMLIGVLCEVVSVVSAVEKETLLVNYVKDTLQTMLRSSGLDADCDDKISKEEFDQLLEKPDAARALQEVGVDVIGLVDFTDFIFQDGKELSFPDFMDVILQLRGTNTATVKDIVDLRKLVVSEFQKISELKQHDNRGSGHA